ncbi:hypothetical protein [Micromonospora sp. RP3T]|uniref:hypothetical protein n=1 Tax=Micromonospora sp. RP3T TaxID=2135446 RepID=UPI003D73BDD4
MTLLYAAVAGDYSPAGRIVRDLLLLHQALPSPNPGRPSPGCAVCFGSGYPLGVIDPRPSQHCHCRCAVCTCHEPLCGGPCHHLSVLLDAVVLCGVPDAAADVPAALARLHHAAIRRIVGQATEPRPVLIGPADGPPGSALVTVSDSHEAKAVEDRLYTAGFRCHASPMPEPDSRVNLIITPVG